jgi:protein-S-isoprenylcysteine O-methyltransferase Ste14
VQINIWVVLLCLAAHQLLKQMTSKGADRYPEGLAKKLQYAIGIPTLLLLVLFLLDPDFSTAVLFPFSPAFTDIGAAVFDGAAILILSAHVSLGRFWSGELETVTGHRLIESGLYGLVRHPLYSSYFVLTLGMFLMTENWLVAGAMLAYFGAVATRVPREEEMLLLRVEGYGSYVLRVGRFVPRWQTIFPSETRRRYDLIDPIPAEDVSEERGPDGSARTDYFDLVR